MDDLRTLTRVKITGPPGECIGRIEDIRTLEDLPPTPERLTIEFAGLDVLDILREWGVTRIALISYRRANDQLVVFTALEIAGKWYDMQQQPLTLEIIGQYAFTVH